MIWDGFSIWDGFWYVISMIWEGLSIWNGFGMWFRGFGKDSRFGKDSQPMSSYDLRKAPLRMHRLMRCRLDLELEPVLCHRQWSTRMRASMSSMTWIVRAHVSIRIFKKYATASHSSSRAVGMLKHLPRIGMEKQTCLCLCLGFSVSLACLSTCLPACLSCLPVCTSVQQPRSLARIRLPNPQDSFFQST